MKMKGTPKRHAPAPDTDEMPHDAGDAPGDHEEQETFDPRSEVIRVNVEGTNADEDEKARHMYVWKKIVKKYTTTEVCPGCAAIGTKHNAAHNDERRRRIQAEMETCDEGKDMLKAEQERMNIHLEK